MGLLRDSAPKGIIVFWSGLKRNIPSGWAVCDGQHGTPDLRGNAGQLGMTAFIMKVKE